MRPWPLAVLALLLGGACAHRHHEATTPRSAPICPALPKRPPADAVVVFGYELGGECEYDSPRRKLAFVHEAPCPGPEPGLEMLPAPDCVHVNAEIMQQLWSVLHDNELHRIEPFAPDEPCVSCQTRSIAASWSKFRCPSSRPTNPDGLSVGRHIIITNYFYELTQWLSEGP